MLNLKDRIINLTRSLLPTGRAWRMPTGSNMERLFKTLAKSESRAVEDATTIFNSLIPDNDMFTLDDATDWERRLGMISNPAVPFADRKAAILRKMAAPGVNPAKGHYLWIQQQLQDAGFAVYVYENIFPVYPNGYMSVAPSVYYGTGNLKKKYYGTTQYGQQGGAYWNNKIANSIIQSQDDKFDLNGSYDSTFFIGGPTLGNYASVLATREVEFRQLILNLKQVQNIGFLFVNYI